MPLRIGFVVVLFFAGSWAARADEPEVWTLLLGPESAADGAVAAAVEDLTAAAESVGLRVVVAEAPPAPPFRAIVVGDGAHNPDAEPLLEAAGFDDKPEPDPQAFSIRTRKREDGTIVSVAGGSTLGEAYGLLWLRERMLIQDAMPELNERRAPAVPVRLTNARRPADLRRALRYTATWVTGPVVDELAPTLSEPVPPDVAARREEAAALARAAHALRMKCLAASDEVSLLPSWIEQFSAELDPDDPHFWEALQAKYRRLFSAVPELDGVQIRTGELTQVASDHLAFDVMHAGPEASLPERYRIFVQKMHEVVVGECDRIYFHRTWVPNVTEQHSDPAVYRAIFTDAVPTHNLYLSPYLSRGDRWYHQPYNPTFNLTPHNMIALLAPLDYHADGSVNVAPAFPGAYHQEGLLRILAPEDSNVRGVHFGLPDEDGWNTRALTAYTVYRLAWEPRVDLREVAEDFAALYVDREAASPLAELLLLTLPAYRDGLYVKPVAERRAWNNLPQLRLTTFEARGFPHIDRGKAHLAWLEENLYEPSKGRFDEAREHLDRGRGAARRMETLCAEAAPRIGDPGMRRRVVESVELARRLIEVNGLYVRTAYAYFDYRNQPDADHRGRLAELTNRLRDEAAGFREAPGCRYRLFGIDALLRAAEDAVADLDRAVAALEAAPDEAALEDLLAEHQRKYAAFAQDPPPGSVKLLTWRGRVDGKEILSVRGRDLAIEHIQDDPHQPGAHRLHAELPERPVTVWMRVLESRPIHPFVLQQPRADNDYTVKVFLFDREPGYGEWALELYYVEGPPESHGLAIPWQ